MAPKPHPAQSTRHPHPPAAHPARRRRLLARGGAALAARTTSPRQRAAVSVGVLAVAASLLGTGALLEHHQGALVADGKVASLPLADLAPARTTDAFVSGPAVQVWPLAARLLPATTQVAALEALPQAERVAVFTTTLPGHPLATGDSGGYPVVVVAVDGVDEATVLASLASVGASEQVDVATPDPDRPERVLIAGVQQTGAAVADVLDRQGGLNTDPAFVRAFGDARQGTWLDVDALRERSRATSLGVAGTRSLDGAVSALVGGAVGQVRSLSATRVPAADPDAAVPDAGLRALRVVLTARDHDGRDLTEPWQWSGRAAAFADYLLDAYGTGGGRDLPLALATPDERDADPVDPGLEVAARLASAVAVSDGSDGALANVSTTLAGDASTGSVADVVLPDRQPGDLAVLVDREAVTAATDGGAATVQNVPALGLTLDGASVHLTYALLAEPWTPPSDAPTQGSTIGSLDDLPAEERLAPPSSG